MSQDREGRTKGGRNERDGGEEKLVQSPRKEFVRGCEKFLPALV